MLKTQLFNKRTVGKNGSMVRRIDIVGARKKLRQAIEDKRRIWGNSGPSIFSGILWVYHNNGH